MLDEKTDRLIEAIQKKKKSFDEELHKTQSDLFSEYFNDDEKLALSIKPEMITRKKKYLTYSYRQSRLLHVAQLDLNIKKQIDFLKKLNLLKSNLYHLSEIYTENIREHQRTIIRQIEIPFHIYSGKILQATPRGSGLFIDSGDYEINKIRFLSTPTTDHDAMYNLSSGQLNALVLAFVLALNKKYCTDDFALLLIDDPIQSMDEINMASFTELLRNDFNDRQIIISTHEPHISVFMRYKFDKYSLKTVCLNMQQLLSEQVLNA